MRGTILQPTYLPWIGYFEMIASTDTFVVFDHVQFARKSWQHRNRIKTANGELMLTIPTRRDGRDTRICDVEVNDERGAPLATHWRTISLAYARAPYFERYKDALAPVFATGAPLLRDTTLPVIRALCDELGIKTNIVLSSSLKSSQTRVGTTEDVVALCKEVGITHLYDAAGAEAILDRSQFERAGIALEFQNYEHPTYAQLWGREFLSHMAAIDLLFNEGPRALDIIMSGRRTPGAAPAPG